jgi:hypothetical protein
MKAHSIYRYRDVFVKEGDKIRTPWKWPTTVEKLLVPHSQEAISFQCAETGGILTKEITDTGMNRLIEHFYSYSWFEISFISRSEEKKNRSVEEATLIDEERTKPNQFYYCGADTLLGDIIELPKGHQGVVDDILFPVQDDTKPFGWIMPRISISTVSEPMVVELYSPEWMQLKFICRK